MHIIKTTIQNKTYCYAAECKWNSEAKKYEKPRKSVGRIINEEFLPNRYLSSLLRKSEVDNKHISEYEKLIIETITTEFGEHIKPREFKSRVSTKDIIQTARVIHDGPYLVFNDITKKYGIESKLVQAFGEDIAQDILALVLYLLVNGSPLSNNSSWLDYFENPKGSGMSSQDVSRLLDLTNYDGMMTFYKNWLEAFTKNDKTLYDLTSISSYGRGINEVNYGYNRDHENLPQVNYALLTTRDKAMPLFAWVLNGSIVDSETLITTLKFLKKMGYTPNCLMLDRGFSTLKNLEFLLMNKYTFLQALKVNSTWIYNLIDQSRHERANPKNMLETGNRVYYTSTINLQLVHYREQIKNKTTEGTFFHSCENNIKGKKFSPGKGERKEVIGQYSCQLHILFCHDLVNSQYDKFMKEIKKEIERLETNPSAVVESKYARYISVEKPKYAKKRIVTPITEEIIKYSEKYSGFLCFLTNDASVATCQSVLEEYSTRDYIEKDFDEMKNDLDMDRIRVHTRERMQARLFIQFLAEIYLRDIRYRLSKSIECRKLTKTEVWSHIQTIVRVKFAGKYNDVKQTLSKSQREIFKALGIEY